MPVTLKVGIIGVNAQTGWAREGHVPAVASLPGLEFAAVATNSQKTAEDAAQAFGVPAAFGNGLDLIRESGVDIVAVTTRVPDHRGLVLAALSAGKHVYCEWPLGRRSAETDELAAAAKAAGVHAAVGLQLRGSPVVRRAQALVAGGSIGRVLSVRAYASTAGFGPVVPSPYLYLEDPRNFANLVTIQGAHTLDLAIALCGALADLSALATAQYPEIAAGIEGERRQRTTFDHLLVQSRFARGGTLSVEAAGGRPPEAPFSMDVVGEAGTLRLAGGSPRGFQASRLSLSLDGVAQAIDEGEIARMPDAAANVAGTYAALRDDIVAGTSTAPSFEHASKLTRLLRDILRSSLTGIRCGSADWPEH